MTHVSAVIIGGGLAGLHAARCLHLAGVDFHLYEARNRSGGRILTVDDTGEPAFDGFDLGPSWFWPHMQPDIAALVGSLDLVAFEQASDGDFVFERSRGDAVRYPAMAQEPVSMRLQGGTCRLIQALLADLPVTRLHLGSPVLALELREGVVAATMENGSITTDRVIAALPPRLLASTIKFLPAPPPEAHGLWQSTPTWMAPHAKFVAVYDKPFWREAGLSGMAQSLAGPMTEIHDASTADGRAALFGFLGVAAKDRHRIGAETLKRACRDQLVRLVGPLAGTPRTMLFKDWSADPLTASPADQEPTGHPAPARLWVTGNWSENLALGGSEASPDFPGYLTGAVLASTIAAQSVISGLR